MSVAKRWKFRSGLPGCVHNVNLTKLDANVVGKVLEELNQRNGHVDPDTLVAESRTRGAPLHAAFEWDDEKWGVMGRRDQAQGLIMAVVIDDPTCPETPEFLHIPEVIIEQSEAAPDFLPEGNERKGYYHARDDVMRDPRLRAYVLRRAVADLDALRRKYADLTELASVFDAVAVVAAQHGFTTATVVPQYRCRLKNGHGVCGQLVTLDLRQVHALQAHDKKIRDGQLAQWFAPVVS